MAYVAHYIVPSRLTQKFSATLKRICSSWTRLGEDYYVAHHSEALRASCPYCSAAEYDNLDK